MLPNQVKPLLIFMGVTDNAGNAVFLVDSTLKATGEGKCKPSHADCAFLYLGAGSEEEFTNEDGDSYRLRDRRDPQGQGRRPRRPRPRSGAEGRQRRRARRSGRPSRPAASPSRS